MKGRIRLRRYEVGIDSDRAARILIDQYGADASRHAKTRMQELLEAGAAAWVDICFAIEEMRRGPTPEEARH